MACVKSPSNADRSSSASMALTTGSIWRFIDGDAVPSCHSQHMREDFCHQIHCGRRVVVLIVSHGELAPSGRLIEPCKGLASVVSPSPPP
jgi:hypothetical protein